MENMNSEDPEEQFDGCECRFCAVGGPGCWRATGIHLKEEVKQKETEISELENCLSRAIIEACRDCPSFRVAFNADYYAPGTRRCFAMGNCRWRFLHTLREQQADKEKQL